MPPIHHKIPRGLDASLSRAIGEGSNPGRKQDQTIGHRDQSGDWARENRADAKLSFHLVLLLVFLLSSAGY